MHKRHRKNLIRGEWENLNAPAVSSLCFLCLFVASFFLCVLCGSKLLASRHNHIIAARIHFVFFQRSGWRTTDVLATQVVLPVVTGAPNLFRVVAVLDDAFQMRADG